MYVHILYVCRFVCMYLFLFSFRLVCAQPVLHGHADENHGYTPLASKRVFLRKSCGYTHAYALTHMHTLLHTMHTYTRIRIRNTGSSEPESSLRINCINRRISVQTLLCRACIQFLVQANLPSMLKVRYISMYVMHVCIYVYVCIPEAIVCVVT
jgi:hypothetical protein